MAILQEIPQPSITKICLTITYLKYHSNFLGTNELATKPPSWCQWRYSNRLGDMHVIIWWTLYIWIWKCEYVHWMYPLASIASIVSYARKVFPECAPTGWALISDLRLISYPNDLTWFLYKDKQSHKDLIFMRIPIPQKMIFILIQNSGQCPIRNCY